MKQSEVDQNNELLFGAPTTEEDAPIIETPKQNDDYEILRIKSANKDKKRKDKRYYTAFKLIIGCLVMLGIVYIIDVFSMAILKQDLSSFTKDIIEIIKTLLFTLSGYLFAKKENGDWFSPGGAIRPYFF